MFNISLSKTEDQQANERARIKIIYHLSGCSHITNNR
jgi:hypothetical protein